MKLSKYVHKFTISKTVVALYHSLTIECVFIDITELNDILTTKNGDNYTYLQKHYFIVEQDSDDLLVFQKALELIEGPSLINTYILTSENCNFACKYCFLSKLTQAQCCNKNMSVEVADQTIKLLQREYKNNPTKYSRFISFFGGEPLLNFQLIKYIVDKISLLIQNKDFPNDIKFGMVTNASLLTEDIIRYCISKDIGIGISFDIIEEASTQRITKKGSSTFNIVKEKISLCQKLGAEFSISTTVTSAILSNPVKVVDEIIRLNPPSISLNMLIPDKGSAFNRSYYHEYADFLIYAYNRLREFGIYEDRMMRKMRAFTNRNLYYNDCCATGGHQFVITHNGRIGVCHAFLNTTGEFFNASVFDENISLSTNSDSLCWSQITPLKKEQCLECECLGICGGGCAYVANNMHGSIGALDDGFCIVSKKILKWMIEDLYKVSNV